MELDGLVPLNEYQPPGLPAEEKVGSFVARVKAMFIARTGQNVIATERLETPSLKRLDDAAEPPACAPLLDDLDRAMKQWLSQPAAPGTLLAVVTPPSERGDVVGTWASGAGLQTLRAPHARTGELDLAAIASLDGDAPLVVPKLERWFLRTPEGLKRMRQLLALLSERRQVLIGCNSFAWAYLAKAIRIDLVAPGPFTFRPFDGAMMEQWLVGLAKSELDGGAAFRIADSGTYLLREGAEEETRHFFETLAGRSLGMPGIAWHMWRDMLRLDDTNEKSGGSQGEHSAKREIFWIAAMDELVLPGDYPRELLFALHALCLHGALTPKQLIAAVPDNSGVAMIPALRGSKLIGFANGELAIRPEAYPAVRAGLLSSGFPVGAI